MHGGDDSVADGGRRQVGLGGYRNWKVSHAV
jgi:hypothetical protein